MLAAAAAGSACVFVPPRRGNVLRRVFPRCGAVAKPPQTGELGCCRVARPGGPGAKALMFSDSRHRLHRCAAFLLAALASLAAPLAAQAEKIVYADGRQEAAKAPAQDRNGRWTVEVEGRRVALKAGEVVAIVDAKGTETTLIPALATAPDSPEAIAALARMRDPKDADWETAAMTLGEHPSRSILDALVELAGSKSKDLRSRGLTGMARLRTKESTVALAEALLAEKDAALRRAAASLLFYVQEVFRRCDAEPLMRRGIGDKDKDVRIAFAQVSRPDLAEGTEVLRRDGIRHGDHHVRESAAMDLGERGDAAGESILIAMLARTRIPGMEGTAAEIEPHLVREKVAICRVLGGFTSEASTAALEKAKASPFEAVRKAAAEALASRVK